MDQQIHVNPELLKFRDLFDAGSFSFGDLIGNSNLAEVTLADLQWKSTCSNIRNWPLCSGIKGQTVIISTLQQQHITVTTIAIILIKEEINSMGAVESVDHLSKPSAQLLTASLDVMFSAYSNVPSLANSNCKWINDGLEDIVKLLDLCNTVSDNITEVKVYEKLLQTPIHSLDHAGMDIDRLSQTPLLIRTTSLLANCRRAIINGNAKGTITTSRSRGILVGIEEVIASSYYSRISKSEEYLSEDMGDFMDCTASMLKTVSKAVLVELSKPSLGLDVMYDWAVLSLRVPFSL